MTCMTKRASLRPHDDAGHVLLAMNFAADSLLLGSVMCSQEAVHQVVKSSVFRRCNRSCLDLFGIILRHFLFDNYFIMLLFSLN